MWAACLEQAAAACSRRPDNAERDGARQFLPHGGRGDPLWAILGLMGADLEEFAGYCLPRLEAIWRASDALGVRTSTEEQIEARRSIAAKSLATRREHAAAKAAGETVDRPPVRSSDARPSKAASQQEAAATADAGRAADATAVRLDFRHADGLDRDRSLEFCSIRISFNLPGSLSLHCCSNLTPRH